VRDYWLAQPVPSVRFTWVRQRNAGKKHAQAVTFTSDHDADIFVTIDSDSALDRRAINEGLKPFADKRVVSVAGLETAINIDRNLLTRAIGHRSLAFQLFAMSAQSAARGSVLINPGAFSLYRAPLIRKIVHSYIGETFFGVPVTLGDDTALTLYALLHGRAVHQPSAVSLPVYPETLEHHLRQWTRWMRASTIRMLWRLRYLPVLSYGWIFTVYTIATFLLSVAVSIAIPLVWPASAKLLLASAAAMVIWPLSVSLRLAAVQRSDQGLFSRLFGIALLPFAALWYVLVLRQIRFYGIATCWRQGWVTRQQVEVRLDGSHDPVPGRAPSADTIERGQPVPSVAFYEGRAGDPRGARPSGVRLRGVRPSTARPSSARSGSARPGSARPSRAGDPRVARDPRFRGTEVVHDPRVVRELDGARYPRAVPDRAAPGRRVASDGRDGQNRGPFVDSRRAGDVPVPREQSARRRARWGGPNANGGQDGSQPNFDSGRGRRAQVAAHHQPDPREPGTERGSRGPRSGHNPRTRNQGRALEYGQARSRGYGFDPLADQDQRPSANTRDPFAGQDLLSRGPRESSDRRSRGSRPQGDPRSPAPRPDQRAWGIAYDSRTAAGANGRRSRYVPGDGGDPQVLDGYGAPREHFAQERQHGPYHRTPADPRYAPDDPWNLPADTRRGLEPLPSPGTWLGGNGQPAPQPRLVRNQLPPEIPESALSPEEHWQ
jgi:hyaluronan synthase